MSIVHFTYNGLEGTVNCEDMKTEEQLRQRLCSLFNFNDSVDFTGIRHQGNDRLYSLQEIVNCPSLFATIPGSVVVGPLSPKSHKKSSTVIENVFKFVFGECSHQGLFKYLDYFVLRVLYNRKSSYFTYAINLMLDNDLDALCRHLHTLISQVKDSTTVKMDILRLITLNMQMNKELTYEHVAILLSLIGKEDGLICAAYNLFEQTDDLAQLKDSLLRILVLMVKPERIDPKERYSAQMQQIENRGSWMRDDSKIDITMILEELDESEVTIYTLFELAVISELEASQLLQIVSESPSALHSFIRMVRSNQSELTNHDLYSLFLSANSSVSGVVHPLYYPFHLEAYPTEPLTESLLMLEKEGVINRIEYILLYKRCMMNSPALRHCYSVYTKNKNQNAFAKNSRLCLSIYNTMKPSKMTQMSDADAMILEEIIVKKLLPECELTWLLNEYNESNEVVINAFSVCKQTGDINGFLSVIQSVMKMYSVYQDAMEAKQFLLVLVKEMVGNHSITSEQAAILTMFIQESNECLIELYKEYKKSGDFEGLLAALIYISSTWSSIEEEGEECEEEEEELSLPSLEQALSVIECVENELTASLVSELKQLIHEGDGLLLATIARYLRDGNKEWLLKELNGG